MNDFRYVLEKESHSERWLIMKFKRSSEDFRGEPVWSINLPDWFKRTRHESKTQACLEFIIRNGDKDLYEIRERDELDSLDLPLGSFPDYMLKKV